jgi:hypothetical protein
MITKLGSPDLGVSGHTTADCAGELPDCPDDPGAMAMCVCGRVWTATIMDGWESCHWYREKAPLTKSEVL